MSSTSTKEALSLKNISLKFLKYWVQTVNKDHAEHCSNIPSWS